MPTMYRGSIPFIINFGTPPFFLVCKKYAKNCANLQQYCQTKLKFCVLVCLKVHWLVKKYTFAVATNMSYTWLKKLSTLSAYGPGAGPDGWLTICPILYLPALTTSLVKFHLRPNHIVKLLSNVGMVFPEKNCPQTVEEALFICFLNISSSFVWPSWSVLLNS